MSTTAFDVLERTDEAQGINPIALLGHASPTMTKRYLRAKKVPEVEGPSFGQVSNIGQIKLK